MPVFQFKILRIFLCGIFCVLILPFSASNAHAKANQKYASIVMDADTGMILHARYADKKLHPASLTKIMTLLMVFDALERGQVKLSDRIFISSHAAGMVPSKLNLPAGSRIRLQDAIYALVTKSANDIAVAIAEHLGGTEYNFGKMMTRQARLMGMNQTRFINASGLHDPRQISTARDMAFLAQVVINRYPSYYRYFSRKNFTYQGKTYRNHNRLMDSYAGMDGMKTGYIQASGFNLVASAIRNDRRIIGVVFGGRSSRTRNAHMRSLLDRGFTKIETLRIASARVPLPPPKPTTLAALQQFKTLEPASGAALKQKLASLKAPFESLGFQKIMGEGDIDLEAQDRIESGLMTMAAHQKNKQTHQRPSAQKTYALAKKAYYKQGYDNVWAIQVGAFNKRGATDSAIAKTLAVMPDSYKQKAKPIVAPLKTPNGWIFRARIAGFTKAEANHACRYLRDCMTVPVY